MMTKDEAKIEKERLLIEIEKLDLILNPDNFNIDVLLTNIFKEFKCFCNWSVYPNSIFTFNKEDVFLMEYDFIKHILWVSYKNIWSIVAEKNPELNYNAIKYLLEAKIMEIFKIKILHVSTRDQGTPRLLEELLTPKSFQ